MYLIIKKTMCVFSQIMPPSFQALIEIKNIDIPAFTSAFHWPSVFLLQLIAWMLNHLNSGANILNVEHQKYFKTQRHFFVFWENMYKMMNDTILSWGSAMKIWLLHISLREGRHRVVVRNASYGIVYSYSVIMVMLSYMTVWKLFCTTSPKRKKKGSKQTTFSNNKSPSIV